VPSGTSAKQLTSHPTRLRVQVPENGPDVMNSESDSDNEQHGDVILNGYQGISVDSNGDPTGSEHGMSNSQADQMRRAAGGSPAQAEDREKSVGAQMGTQKGTGQETQKGGHPMTTRSEERAAGGARVAAGSGQTDTCVAKGHPSQT
jgi:hypothetical protein